MGLFKKNIEPKTRIIRSNASYIRARSIGKKPAVVRYIQPVNAGLTRSFDGGKNSRFTENWTGLNTNINYDLHSYKTRLDERAEDLIKNNPHIAGYVIKEIANQIGHKGFALQVQTTFPNGDLDEFANSFIERKFKEWSKKEFCTMHGNMSFLRVQWHIVQSLIGSGEYLIRKVINVPLDENPFSFSQEILDPRDIDITYSEVLNENEIVLMGVHINKWRKIKGVYLKPVKLGYEVTYGSAAGYHDEGEYIKAEDMYFDYDPLINFGIKQIRGFTPLASSILLMRMIDQWTFASLTNAAASAKKMGFLIRKNMSTEKFVGKTKKNPDGTETEQEDDEGGKYMDFQDASIEELPFGYEFIGWDPKYPHEQHVPFTQSLLKTFASSRGINFNSFANEYGGVTFSSLRAGAIDERDIWKLKQVVISDSYCCNLYYDWLYYSLLYQALAPLQFQNIKRYVNHNWMAKRWPWVKPLEDAQAKRLMITMGVESPIAVAAELGNDINEIYRDLAYVKKLAEKTGVTPNFLIEMMLKDKPEPASGGEEEIEEVDQDEEDAKELRLLNSSHEITR